MEKWFNSSGTKMLNIDSVISYTYYGKAHVDGHPPLTEGTGNQKPVLKVKTLAGDLEFIGEDAVELYKMLSSTRRVL